MPAHMLLQTSLKKEVISDLEDRYIKLLESRIAHLELQLENRKLESGPGVKVCDSRGRSGDRVQMSY
jgi:hypothetical protein